MPEVYRLVVLRGYFPVITNEAILASLNDTPAEEVLVFLRHAGLQSSDKHDERVWFEVEGDFLLADCARG